MMEEKSHHHTYEINKATAHEYIFPIQISENKITMLISIASSLIPISYGFGSVI